MQVESYTQWFVHQLSNISPDWLSEAIIESPPIANFETILDISALLLDHQNAQLHPKDVVALQRRLSFLPLIHKSNIDETWRAAFEDAGPVNEASVTVDANVIYELTALPNSEWAIMLPTVKVGDDICPGFFTLPRRNPKRFTLFFYTNAGSGFIKRLFRRRQSCYPATSRKINVLECKPDTCRGGCDVKKYHDDGIFRWRCECESR